MMVQKSFIGYIGLIIWKCKNIVGRRIGWIKALYPGLTNTLR